MPCASVAQARGVAVDTQADCEALAAPLGLTPAVVAVAGLCDHLAGFPRHLSQHVGGFVLTQGPLTRLVPVENAAMPDRSIIQWDKGRSGCRRADEGGCAGAGHAQCHPPLPGAGDPMASVPTPMRMQDPRARTPLPTT